ncbi:MAG: hypothetical protein N2422_04430 [Rhodobacteraceae bacterium]|nr:hypothetical protein [Paracoccaceae bacterium]
MRSGILSAIVAVGLPASGAAFAHELSTVKIKSIDHGAMPLTAEDGTVLRFDASTKKLLEGLTPGNVVAIMWENADGIDHHVAALSTGM